MKLHANAALSLRQRERMVSRVVEEGWSITKAAMAAEVSEQTCSKWVHRYRQEGEAGLVDRSSAPQHVANRTDEDVIQVIAAFAVHGAGDL
jgi:transposase